MLRWLFIIEPTVRSSIHPKHTGPHVPFSYGTKDSDYPISDSPEPDLTLYTFLCIYPTNFPLVLLVAQNSCSRDT
jgi:hypothetical protein